MRIRVQATNPDPMQVACHPDCTSNFTIVEGRSRIVVGVLNHRRQQPHFVAGGRSPLPFNHVEEGEHNRHFHRAARDEPVLRIVGVVAAARHIIDCCIHDTTAVSQLGSLRVGPTCWEERHTTDEDQKAHEHGSSNEEAELPFHPCHLAGWLLFLHSGVPPVCLAAHFMGFVDITYSYVSGYVGDASSLSRSFLLSRFIWEECLGNFQSCFVTTECETVGEPHFHSLFMREDDLL